MSLVPSLFVSVFFLLIFLNYPTISERIEVTCCACYRDGFVNEFRHGGVVNKLVSCTRCFQIFYQNDKSYRTEP